MTKDESGLFGQNQKGAEEGGETAKAVETPDAGKNQQTEAVKEVKVQGTEETKQDGAAEKTDAKEPMQQRALQRKKMCPRRT